MAGKDFAEERASADTEMVSMIRLCQDIGKNSAASEGSFMNQ